MLTLIRKWWHKRQRQLDIEILWPACKAQVTYIEHARDVFREHAFNDPAWQELGDKLDSTIDSLE